MPAPHHVPGGQECLEEVARDRRSVDMRTRWSGLAGASWAARSSLGEGCEAPHPPAVLACLHDVVRMLVPTPAMCDLLPHAP